MKARKIESLGISPFPWRVEKCTYDDTRVECIVDANGKIIVETDSGCYPPEVPDATIMAAAPQLYRACYEMLRYYFEQDTNTTVFYNALALMNQAVREAAGGQDSERN